MSFLLDTNTISEPTRPRPDRAVTDWLATQPLDTLFLSVITLGEVQRGILNTADPVRRARLEAWYYDTLFPAYRGRILDVTPQVMTQWASLYQAAKVSGRTPPCMDSLLAATAAHHRLTVVTRNESDFASMGVPILNVWTV